MSENAAVLLDEVDWETLILEVQTEPALFKSSIFGTFYALMFPYIENLAFIWLRNSNLSESSSQELASHGLMHVVDQIQKFEFLDETGTLVEYQFKSWVAVVCRNEWIALLRRQKRYTNEIALESIDSNFGTSGVSGEREEAPSDVPRCKSRGLEILREELSKLPESVRNAIIETEDTKSVVNPIARGLGGETSQISDKYGLKPGAIRTRRSRLLKKVTERLESEDLI